MTPSRGRRRPSALPASLQPRPRRGPHALTTGTTESSCPRGWVAAAARCDCLYNSRVDVTEETAFGKVPVIEHGIMWTGGRRRVRDATVQRAGASAAVGGALDVGERGPRSDVGEGGPRRRDGALRPRSGGVAARDAWVEGVARPAVAMRQMRRDTPGPSQRAHRETDAAAASPACGRSAATGRRYVGTGAPVPTVTMTPPSARPGRRHRGSRDRRPAREHAVALRRGGGGCATAARGALLPMPAARRGTHARHKHAAR